MNPKYQITVDLASWDGNAFLIIARVVKALKDEGVSKEEVSRYMDQARAGSYDDLLRTTMEWVIVE